MTTGFLKQAVGHCDGSDVNTEMFLVEETNLLTGEFRQYAV